MRQLHNELTPEDRTDVLRVRPQGALCARSQEMADPEPVLKSDMEWLKSYSAEVEETYSQRFRDESRRFQDGQRLVKRFTQALAQVLRTNWTSFRAVDEAHNELCIAYALLQNSNSQFSSVCYEPPLPHCTKSIDFMAVVGEEVTVF